MFKKLSLFALLAPLASLASGFTISAPLNPTSQGVITVNWTTTQGDPESFTIELINVVFNNAFALANNVDSSLGTLTLTLPVVPAGDGYTIQAVNIGNINDVFATSGTFSIGPVTSTSSSSTTSSGSGTTTRTTSGTGTTTTRPSTTSGTTTSSPTANTNNASTSSTSTSTGPAVTPTSFNNGAGAAFKVPAGGVALALLSAVGGAALVAL